MKTRNTSAVLRRGIKNEFSMESNAVQDPWQNPTVHNNLYTSMKNKLGKLLDNSTANTSTSYTENSASSNTTGLFDLPTSVLQPEFVCVKQEVAPVPESLHLNNELLFFPESNELVVPDIVDEFLISELSHNENMLDVYLPAPPENDESIKVETETLDINLPELLNNENSVQNNNNSEPDAIVNADLRQILKDKHTKVVSENVMGHNILSPDNLKASISKSFNRVSDSSQAASTSSVALKASSSTSYNRVSGSSQAASTSSAAFKASSSTSLNRVSDSSQAASTSSAALKASSSTSFNRVSDSSQAASTSSAALKASSSTSFNRVSDSSQAASTSSVASLKDCIRTSFKKVSEHSQASISSASLKDTITKSFSKINSSQAPTTSSAALKDKIRTSFNRVSGTLQAFKTSSDALRASDGMPYKKVKSSQEPNTMSTSMIDVSTSKVSGTSKDPKTSSATLRASRSITPHSKKVKNSQDPNTNGTSMKDASTSMSFKISGTLLAPRIISVSTKEASPSMSFIVGGTPQDPNTISVSTKEASTSMSFIVSGILHAPRISSALPNPNTRSASFKDSISKSFKKVISNNKSSNSLIQSSITNSLKRESSEAENIQEQFNKLKRKFLRKIHTVKRLNKTKMLRMRRRKSETPKARIPVITLDESNSEEDGTAQMMTDSSLQESSSASTSSNQRTANVRNNSPINFNCQEISFIPNHCYICSKSFQCNKELKEHFMNKHKIGQISSKILYPCDFCTRKFSCKKLREYHVRNNHENIITCKNCKKNFLFLYSYNYHLSRCVYKRPKSKKIKKREILFNCRYCDSEFIYEVSLNNHIKYAHNDFDNYCETCKKPFNEIYSVHVKTCKETSQDGSYELCQFCDKSYPVESMKYHMKWRHEDKVTGNRSETLVETEYDSEDDLVPKGSAENVRHVIHCLSCAHDISNKNFFSEHIQTCLADEYPLCPFCPELEFDGDFVHHLKVHNCIEIKNCYCKLCHKFFFNSYNKNLHCLKYHPNQLDSSNVDDNGSKVIYNNVLLKKKINFNRIKCSLSNMIKNNPTEIRPSVYENETVPNTNSPNIIINENNTEIFNEPVRNFSDELYKLVEKNLAHLFRSDIKSLIFCDSCHLYLSVRLYICHIKKCIHNKSLKCPFCRDCTKLCSDLVSLRHLYDHFISFNTSGKFKCKYCKLLFFSECNKDLHVVNKHEGLQDISCDVCNVAFSDKVNLESHIKYAHVYCECS